MSGHCKECGYDGCVCDEQERANRNMNKPKTKKEWAAYRAQLTCIIGKKQISHAVDNDLCLDKVIAGALYHLLNAIHDLALLGFDPTDQSNNHEKHKLPKN